MEIRKKGIKSKHVLHLGRYIINVTVLIMLHVRDSRFICMFLLHQSLDILRGEHNNYSKNKGYPENDFF